MMNVLVVLLTKFLCYSDRGVAALAKTIDLGANQGRSSESSLADCDALLPIFVLFYPTFKRERARTERTRGLSLLTPAHTQAVQFS